MSLSINNTQQDGLNLLADETKWQYPQKALTSMHYMGKLLVQMNAIEVPIGADIVVVFNTDDADTLAAGVVSELNQRFPQSKVKVVCTWTVKMEEQPLPQILTPISKIYSEPYDKDNMVIVAITSGQDAEEYAILRTNITRMLTDYNYQNPVYVVGPITQPKLNERLIEEFSDKLDLKFISFSQINKPLVGNTNPKYYPWYFNAITNHIDHALNNPNVPDFIVERREKLKKQITQ